MEDVGVMLDYAANHEEAADGPAGAHGYCMSGPYALAAAARYPDRIAAAASFHGTWLVSDAEESPHLTFAKSRGEIYISCAEHDEVAPLDMVEGAPRAFRVVGRGGRGRGPPRRAPRLRLPGALVLRPARRGTALGAADRPLPPPPRLTPPAPAPPPPPRRIHCRGDAWRFGAIPDLGGGWRAGPAAPGLRLAPEYRRLIAGLEDLPANASGADKSWVHRAHAAAVRHFASAKRR